MNFLAWATEMAFRPTLRNLTEGYEAWAYRKGLLRRVHDLERKGFLTVERSLGDRLYRLTEAGRLRTVGGRDPEAKWSRAWDGEWRLVVYDVPVKRDTYREKLRRYLRGQWFGLIQGSVWITPDPLTAESRVLAGGQVDVGSLILLSARPCASETDQDIVRAAWDFKTINAKYRRYIHVLDEVPSNSPAAVARWASLERAAWLDAVSSDPLLPGKLLPPDYLGCIAWQKRQLLRQRAT